MRAKEILLPLDCPPREGPFGYFGIVLTASDLKEVLECIRGFRKAHERGATLRGQIHDCPWHGGFYRGKMDDHLPTGTRLAVQKMVVGEFSQEQPTFEVDPAGHLITVSEEEVFVGVRWRAYEPASREQLRSRALSGAFLEELYYNLSST